MSSLSADILFDSDTDEENEDDVLLRRFDEQVAGDPDGGAAARAAMVFVLGDLTLSPQRATEIIFAARAELDDWRDHSGDAEPPITTYDIIDAVLNLLEQRMEWTYVEGQWIPLPNPPPHIPRRRPGWASAPEEEEGEGEDEAPNPLLGRTDELLDELPPDADALSLLSELNLDFRARAREDVAWCTILATQDQNSIVGLRDTTLDTCDVVLNDPVWIFGLDPAQVQLAARRAPVPPAEIRRVCAAVRGLTYTKLAFLILNQDQSRLETLLAAVRRDANEYGGIDVAGNPAFQTHFSVLQLDMAVLRTALRCFREYCDNSVLPVRDGRDDPTARIVEQRVCVLAAIADSDIPFPNERSLPVRMFAACRRALNWSKQDTEGGLVVAPDAGGGRHLWGPRRAGECGFGKIDIRKEALAYQVRDLAGRVVRVPGGVATFDSLLSPNNPHYALEDLLTGRAFKTLTQVMADWLIEGLPYLPRAAQEDLALLQHDFKPLPLLPVGRHDVRRIQDRVELLFPVLNDQGQDWRPT